MRHPEVLAGLALLWLALLRGAVRLRRRGGAVGYAEYMRSGLWRRKRTACLRAAGYRCRVRGCAARARTAHHPGYPKRLGSEPWWDLVALCWPHHRAIHARARALWRRGRRVSLRQVTDDVLAGRWAA